MYTVYKITNIQNGKYYIGVHKTDNPNDSYFGSGKAIKEAIEKYGKDSFVKNILLITEDKEEAYNKEKELTLDFFSRNTYNMKLGGIGGFDKEISKKGYNKVKDKLSKLGGKAAVEQKKGVHALSKEQLIENGRKGGLANAGLNKKRKPYSEERKKQISNAIKKKWQTTEYKLKTMAGNKNRNYNNVLNKRIVSAETKEKISLAMKLRWNKKKQEMAIG